MRSNTSSALRFLNVDLIIRSKTDLEPLVAAMGNRVLVLYLGREHRAYKACLEVSGMSKTPESTIRAFCRLIQGLPPSARRLWSGAKLRMFNIGIESPLKGSEWFEISEETVADAAKLKVRIAVTVYGKLKKAKLSRKST
jgi:hypothetical protein